MSYCQSIRAGLPKGPAAFAALLWDVQHEQNVKYPGSILASQSAASTLLPRSEGCFVSTCQHRPPRPALLAITIANCHQLLPAAAIPTTADASFAGWSAGQSCVILLLIHRPEIQFKAIYMLPKNACIRPRWPDSPCIVPKFSELLLKLGKLMLHTSWLPAVLYHRMGRLEHRHRKSAAKHLIVRLKLVS